MSVAHATKAGVDERMTDRCGLPSCVHLGSASIVHRKTVIEPRGLRREDAARYLGVSPTTLDSWVSKRLMPRPHTVGGIVVWDRYALDRAFEALPGGAESDQDDPWNQVAA